MESLASSVPVLPEAVILNNSGHHHLLLDFALSSAPAAPQTLEDMKVLKSN